MRPILFEELADRYTGPDKPGHQACSIGPSEIEIGVNVEWILLFLLADEKRPVLDDRGTLKLLQQSGAP